MTIGFVLDDTIDSTDGVQQAVLTLGEEMAKRGHAVHYIVAESKREDIETIHSVAKILKLKFNGNTVRTPFPASKKKIKKIFGSVDFDVLYVQMPYSPWLSSRVIKLAPKTTKIFGTFHILPYSKNATIGTHILGRLLRRSLQRFEGFYAVSAPANRFMHDTFSVAGSVLPNPINYSFFSSYAPKKPVSKNQITFLGRFDERKGVLKLVESFAKLPTELRENAEFIMCGKGPLLGKAKSLAAQLGVTVTFPGFVSDEQKAVFLAESTIAVFPSVSGESFGIVLAEAMASGAQITLGGNNPGYASVLHEWPETLFDATNADAISDRIATYLINKEARKRIGKQQHAYVKEFDVKTIVSKLESDYTCSLLAKEG